jgi:hypothetical protein
MMVNEELIRQTAHYIRQHPQEWDQNDYENRVACGTTRCFGGWSIAIAHEFPTNIYRLSHMERLSKLRELGVSVIDERTGCEWDEFTLSESATYARLLLGLDFYQADAIFYDLDPDSLSSYLDKVERITGVQLSPPFAPMGTVG